MKKLILTLGFVVAISPAVAQENMTFGHDNNVKNYRVIKTPGSDNTVVIVRDRQLRPTSLNCKIPSGLIGKSIDDINGMRFNHPLRIVRPGEPMTMDYQEDRVNLILDDQGIIRGIRCG